MEQVQASSRYGTILFFLSTVLLLATALLNNSLALQKESGEKFGDWYWSTESMLGKARSSGQRGTNFFSAVSLQILSSEWREKTGKKVHDGPGAYWHEPTSLPGFYYVTLTVDPESGDFRVRSSGVGDLDFLDDPLFRRLEEDVAKFGQQAREIDQLTVPGERKLQLLDAALAKSFSSKDAREILADDFADILVYKKEAARNTRCWIVYGSWPCGGHTATRVSSGVSYLKRDENVFLHPSYRESHISTALGMAKSQDEMEAILHAEWIKAEENLIELKTAATQVSLPGTGLTLTVGDLLLLAGPLLIFFQVLFLISKEKVAKSEEEKAAFAFPQFSSPDDPLKPPLASGIAELGERAIWLLFLILPVFVLTVAVVARHDFTAFSLYDSQSLLTKIGWTRSEDWFSAVLDLVNLGSLGATLIIGVRLTTLHRSPIRRFPDRVHRILAVLAFLATTVTLVTAGWSLLGSDTEQWGLFFTAFTFIWLLCFCHAVTQRAWTMTSISVVGCALGLTILLV